jgi:hypothetical protein
MSADPHSPWAACDGFRLNHTHTRTLQWRSGEADLAVSSSSKYTTTVTYNRNGTLDIDVNLVDVSLSLSLSLSLLLLYSHVSLIPHIHIFSPVIFMIERNAQTEWNQRESTSREHFRRVEGRRESDTMGVAE